MSDQPAPRTVSPSDTDWHHQAVTILREAAVQTAARERGDKAPAIVVAVPCLHSAGAIAGAVGLVTILAGRLSMSSGELLDWATVINDRTAPEVGNQ